MPQLVNCPNCRRQLNVPDELLGQSVRCSDCQTVFAVAAALSPFAGVGGSAPAGDGAAFTFTDHPDNERSHRGARLLIFGILSIPSAFGGCGYSLLPSFLAPRYSGIQIVLLIALLTISTIGLLVCWGFSGAAMSMGHADLTAMARGRMDRSGKALTQIGRICGGVGMGISLAILSLECLCVLNYFVLHIH